MNPALQKVLSRLKGVKKDGKGWKALCPAHNDRKPSLKIDETEDGRILLKCFAGCGIENIVAAIGLKMSDLYPEGPSNTISLPQIVADYIYRDETGKILFRVCRTNPKGFYQQRPDGRGGWINGRGDVEPVLYRLPEVIKAVQAGQTIFIVEGEKDVENLVRLGLVATTSPGGAQGWKKHYAKYLEGANLVLLPDNDDPGRKYVEGIAKSLRGKAKSIKIIDLPDLPEHGDVSDWLQAGGTKEELLAIVEKTLEWEPEPKDKEKGRRKKTKDNEEVKPIQTSFLEANGKLYEQIYLGDTSVFIEYDPETDQAQIVEKVMANDEIYVPIGNDGKDPEELKFNAVRLPSAVIEYGDTLTLLSEIESFIYHYLDVSSTYRKFASYYILLSWVYDRFNTLPYLRAIGDTGCGKSRFLDVIGLLCYKPIVAAGCITPAPVFRMLKKWSGTLIIDEADLKNSDEYNEVVTILNCGFERGRAVIRATKDRPDELQFFPVYGPKVFATRRRFKDAALEARCLTEIMQETSRIDIPPVLGFQFQREQEVLRNKLLLFRFRNYYKVNPEQDITVNLNVEPRLRQISQAFLTLFAGQKDALNEYMTFIREHQQSLIEERLSTPVGMVVESFLSRTDSATLATLATLATGERILDFSAKDISDDTGLDVRTVGQILKTLGLTTKQMKREGKVRRYFVYDKAKIQILRRRYSLPDEETGSVGSMGSISSVLRENKNIDLMSLNFD